MHLYFFLRGVYHQLEIMKTLLQGQFFCWKRKVLRKMKIEGKEFKKGDIIVSAVQGALRPTLFGAYEYVFPREALPDVLSILGIADNAGDFQKKKFRVFCLRKVFGCRKIPDKIFKQAQKINPIMIINGSNRALSTCVTGGVATHFIGIKDDKYQKWHDIGFEQEML